MRIKIPSNPTELITLAKAIMAQHEKLGAASPLNGIEDIERFGPLVATADTTDKAAADLYKQAETAIETRDNALGPDTTTKGFVRFFVTSSREVLGGLNKGSEHKLGVWGFEVNETPQATPEVKAARAAAKAAKQAKPAS